MSQGKSRFPHLLTLVAIAAFALWCIYALRADLSRVSLGPVVRAWPLALFAVLLSLLNYLLRIGRWRWYLRRLGHRVAFRFAALTYLAGFSFTLSPGKVGEMARARYYVEVGIPLPDVAAAFCVERLMDLLAMLALAALMLGALPHYRSALWVAAVIVGAALLVLIATPWKGLAELAGRLGAARGTSHRSRACHWIGRLLGGLVGMLAAARALQRPQVLLLGFAIALAAWGCEGIGLFSLASMFPAVPLAPTVAIGVYAVAVLIGALSFLPGGLGSTEAMLTTLLVSQGFPVPQAFLITMVCRIVTLWLAVCLGWAAIAILRQRSITAELPSWR
ncbi:MAG TPA: lysylphosphatidylglycerol synthase transmembrane domain-containing protein [Steroidobacteraceae bacterium]